MSKISKKIFFETPLPPPKKKIKNIATHIVCFDVTSWRLRRLRRSRRRSSPALLSRGRFARASVTYCENRRRQTRSGSRVPLQPVRRPGVLPVYLSSHVCSTTITVRPLRSPDRRRDAHSHTDGASTAERRGVVQTYTLWL